MHKLNYSIYAIPMMLLLAVTVRGSVEATVAEENWTSITAAPGAFVTINTPAKLTAGAPTRLIFYALPNGNTTSMTIGKKTGPADDWHYNIQHIGAQTRRLRELLPDENIIVAYLEAEGKSWPTWRAKRPDNGKIIREIVDSVRDRFAQYSPKVTLSGHSGGGSFIFGFINGGDTIPGFVERIAVIDANYAYSDKDNHGDKLLKWLEHDSHYLCVIAYDDREITFDGKKVVGPEGGTWRATHRMISRFMKDVQLTSDTLETSGIIHYTGRNERINMFLHPNPENKILHTVLVEKNGFIFANLVGSPEAKKSDPFWGDAHYSKWIK